MHWLTPTPCQSPAAAGRLLAVLLLAAACAPSAYPAQATQSAQSGQPRQPVQTTLTLAGKVRAADGTPLAGVQVTAGSSSTLSAADGSYLLELPPGPLRIEIHRGPELAFSLRLDLEHDRTLDITLSAADTVLVRAANDVLAPDPAASGYLRQDLIEANPGRPGVPLSIPGFPVDTASGGIKAPQYFAPGVAGDHGEPVAQFFSIAGFLFQNNLTANAHGNGYADPNIIIGSTLGGVLVDNAGFDARYGDHSINLAVTYEVLERTPRFLVATADPHDGSVSAAWSSRNPSHAAWFAAEALFGNGFLARPEARQQYKLEALRNWQPGRHTLTAFGLGYYGFSRIPGLIPLRTPVADDTIDPRQLDLTHTALALLTDSWQIAPAHTLLTGLYLRTYSLKLQSDFGDGLIRQSEFRTVAGATSTYTQPLGPGWNLLAGLELRRDAPRGLDLARANPQGRFAAVTSNDLTLTTLAPFAAVSGRLAPWASLYAGVRRDQIRFANRDHLSAAGSFTRWPGVTSPKASLTLGSLNASRLPQLSLSFGEAFHANDPRIGSGDASAHPGQLIIHAREFQLFATQQLLGNEVRVTLARIANSLELAKIDPDTGLQQNVGPSLNRYVTVALRRRSPRQLVQLSWSEADARDRQTGQPIPEAPRMIVDALASLRHLPFDLGAKAEYEYIKAKPLGDGFNGLPLQEIKLDLRRDLRDGRLQLSLDVQLNHGATGQTTETLALPGDAAPFERAVGVPTRSYAAIGARWNFER